MAFRFENTTSKPAEFISNHHETIGFLVSKSSIQPGPKVAVIWDTPYTTRHHTNLI